jgi:hypothetical protein
LQTETSTAVVTDNATLRIATVRTKSDSLLGVIESRANRSAVIQLGDGRKVGCIFPIPEDITTTPEMLKDAATEEYNTPYVAMALVSPKTAMRTLGNFYMWVNRPVTPTRFFSTVDSSEMWLTDLITE